MYRRLRTIFSPLLGQIFFWPLSLHCSHRRPFISCSPAASLPSFPFLSLRHGARPLGSTDHTAWYSGWSCARADWDLGATAAELQDVVLLSRPYPFLNRAETGRRLRESHAVAAWCRWPAGARRLEGLFEAASREPQATPSSKQRTGQRKRTSHGGGVLARRPSAWFAVVICIWNSCFFSEIWVRFPFVSWMKELRFHLSFFLQISIPIKCFGAGAENRWEKRGRNLSYRWAPPVRTDQKLAECLLLCALLRLVLT